MYDPPQNIFLKIMTTILSSEHVPTFPPSLVEILRNWKTVLGSAGSTPSTLMMAWPFELLPNLHLATVIPSLVSILLHLSLLSDSHNCLQCWGREGGREHELWGQGTYVWCNTIHHESSYSPAIFNFCRQSIDEHWPTLWFCNTVLSLVSIYILKWFHKNTYR